MPFSEKAVLRDEKTRSVLPVSTISRKSFSGRKEGMFKREQGAWRVRKISSLLEPRLLGRWI